MDPWSLRPAWMDRPVTGKELTAEAGRAQVRVAGTHQLLDAKWRPRDHTNVRCSPQRTCTRLACPVAAAAACSARPLRVPWAACCTCHGHTGATNTGRWKTSERPCRTRARPAPWRPRGATPGRTPPLCGGEGTAPSCAWCLGAYPKLCSDPVAVSLEAGGAARQPWQWQLCQQCPGLDW